MAAATPSDGFGAGTANLWVLFRMQEDGTGDSTFGINGQAKLDAPALSAILDKEITEDDTLSVGYWSQDK